MEQLLKGWRMPDCVVEAFADNKISESHLNYITDDQLKELCPILGTRIELRKHISEYLLSQAPTETESSVSDNLAELPGDITLDGDISFSLTDLFKNKPTFKDFDLNTLLTLSPWGKSITEYYYMNGCLDIKRRNRLTDIIIRHLFTFIVNSRLTYEDYNIITGKIITLFPKESAATYFTNPIRKSDSFKGKSIAARGKLIDKVRNVLYESGERKRKRLDTYSNIVQEGSSLSQFDALKDEIDWLSTHDEPWAEVIENWKKTAVVRHSEPYNGNIEQFISQWSILNSPKAVDLIEEDFNYLYPGKTNFFFLNWHNFIESLLLIKKSHINADTYKENLANSLKYIDIEDQKIPSQLMLLVHLVPPKGRYSKKEKFSIQECLESFMVIVENPGDISSTVDKQKEKALKKKLPVQPYLILLGDLQNIRQLYLVVDKIRYTFNSIQKAFDTLFKCYHVFNAKYPKASDHIFLIVQRCVYDIITKYDNTVPYIADILKLAACRQQ